MSDPEPIPENPADSSPAEPATSDAPAKAEEKSADAPMESGKAKKKKKKRSWKRRFTILLVAVFAFVILFRVGLSVAFPIVLKKVAASYGLVADYDRFQLSLTGGDVGIGRLTFTPQGSSEPFVSVRYLRATISPFKLFKGELEVWHFEADGVDVDIERDEHGKIAMLDRLLGADQPPPPAPPPSSGPAKIDLTSPLAIEGFRLQNVRVRLRDRSLSPPLDTTLRVDLRVDDVGSANRPATFELQVACDPLLDALHVQAEGRAAGANLETVFNAQIKGLHLKPLAGYLAPMGLRPVADSLAMQASGRITTTPAGLAKAATNLAVVAVAQPSTNPTLKSGSALAANIPAKAAGADAVACQIAFSRLAIHVDGDEAAAVDSIVIDATKLNSSTATVNAMVLDGIRANAARNLDGNIVVAGIEMFPVAAASTSAATTKPATQPSAPAATPAKPFVASLSELSLRNVLLSVKDDFVEPPSSLQFAVDHFTISDIMVDPAKPDAQVKISAAFAAPGIFRKVSLDGTAKPFAVTRSVDLRLAGDGVSPGALRPYLDLVGLESHLVDATFTASLTASATIDDDTGKIGADAHLGNIKFRDRKELFALDDVRFEGVSFDPKTGDLKIGVIEVVGPRLSFQREANSGFSGLGFTTKQWKKGRERKLPPEAPSEMKLAKFELGRFTWKGVKIDFEDAGATPPQTVSLADAGVEVSDLLLDFESPSPKPKPGKFRAWLDAPKIADKLEISGTMTPTPKNLDFDVTVSGSGITAAGVADYLKPLGIEPVLKNGAFTAHAVAKLTLQDGGASAGLQLDKIRYTDGDAELAGVDLLKIEKIAINDKTNTVTISPIEIQRPRIAVMRDKDNTLVAGGIRLLNKTPSTQPAAPAAPAKVAAAPTDSPTAPPSLTAAQVAVANTNPATQPTKPQLVTILEGLKVTEASVAWTDLATTRPVHTTLHADLKLSRVTVGGESDPVDLDVTVRVDDVLEKATVTGKLLPGPSVQGATLKIAASGVRGTALAPYLPPGINLTLKDGRFAAQIDAKVEQAKAGGMNAKLVVSGVDWRDGQNGPALLKLDQFRVIAPRIDPQGLQIAIDEIFVGGVEIDVAKATDGSLQAMGISVGKAPPADEAADPSVKETKIAETADVAAAPATQPAGGVVAAAPPATMPAMAARPKALPLITLKTLDLNLSRLTYRDLSAPPGSAPLSIADARVHNLNKIVLFGEDPMSTPPMKLEIGAQIDPLIEKVAAQLQIAPFAQQPSLQADLSLSGIHGDGIFALAPKLREQIDAAELKNGQFKTHAELQMKVDRRGPMDVEFFKRPFTIETLLVKGTEFRATPDGPVLVGLDELRVDDTRVKPSDGSVRVKSVDVSKFIAQIIREKDGIHACGLVVKLPATQPATAPSTGPATQPDIVQLPPKETPATGPTGSQPVVVQKPDGEPQKTGGEIRIDKLVISGVEMQIEDRSVDPVVIIPITAFDLEARDLSSFATKQDIPIRFVLSANAGKVKLPKKVKGGVIGAVGDVANLIGGQKVDEKPEFEDRELFAQIAASGRISLYPKPVGWAKANVSGFETAGIAGFAKQKEITLSHGTFDVTADVRLKENGVAEVIANPSFTDLNVTEPANGPIVRYLKLPGALDVAIKAVEAADKSITLPVNVKIKEKAGGGYALEGVESTIVDSVSSVISKAILAAPVKVVTGAAEILGVDKLLGGGKPKVEEPIVLQFPAGAAGLEAAESTALSLLVLRMRNEPDLQVAIKHDLGGGDEKLAAIRANPPAADVRAIAASLHRRKFELAQLRASVAAESRVRLASGAGPDAKATLDRLRAIDRDSARTEDALDWAYDMLRPGADRQASNRTRAAGLALARERLEVIRQTLSDAKVPDVNTRLKAAAPQFNPGETADGGTITITLVHVKK